MSYVLYFIVTTLCPVVLFMMQFYLLYEELLSSFLFSVNYNSFFGMRVLFCQMSILLPIKFYRSGCQI